MSDNENDFFALPPFKPEEALLQLKRFVREQRQLAERGSSEFTLRGQAVLSVAVDGAVLNARLAKRPAQRPEWEAWTCRSSADVRRLQDEIKKRLARWTMED